MQCPMLMLMLMQVTRVPAGVRPDDVFEVVLDLRLFSVICPLDAEGGDNIAIVAPDPRLKEGEEGTEGRVAGRGVFDSSVLSLQKPFLVNTAPSVAPVPACAGTGASSMTDDAVAFPLDIESQDRLPWEHSVVVGAGSGVGVGVVQGESAHMKAHAEAVSVNDLKETAIGASDTGTCSVAAPLSTNNAESLAAAAAVRAAEAELSSCEKPRVLDVVDLSSTFSPPSGSLCSPHPGPDHHLTAVLQSAASAPSSVPPFCERPVPIPIPEHCALKGDASADVSVEVSACKKHYSYTAEAGVGAESAPGAAGAGADNMSAVTDKLENCQGDQQHPTSRAPKSDSLAGLSETDTETLALTQQQQRQRSHTPLGDEDTSASVANLILNASHNANAQLKSTSEMKSSAALDLNQLARSRNGEANCGYDAAQRTLVGQDSSQPVAVKWGNRKQGVDSIDRVTRNASTKCPLCTYENSERDVITNASFCGVCRQDLRGAVHTPVAVKIPLATPCLTVISSIR
jgi:hypothetical protein